MWRCPHRAFSLPQTGPHICRSVNQSHLATVFSVDLQPPGISRVAGPWGKPAAKPPVYTWTHQVWIISLALICHLSASPNVLALAPICPQGGLKFTCLITQKTFPMAIMYLSGEWIDNAVHRLIIIPALKVSVVDHRMEQFSAWCTVGRINLMTQKLNPYIKINLFGRSFWWLHLV